MSYVDAGYIIAFSVLSSTSSASSYAGPP